MLDTVNTVVKPVAEMGMGMNVFPWEKDKPKVPRNVLVRNIHSQNVPGENVLGQNGPLQKLRNVHG